jgi:uncharacterized protein YbjT (DUF2867 family)
MKKKILTVFGATGAQGGSVARAILEDANSPFSVPAVTRDPDSEKAQALHSWEQKLSGPTLMMPLLLKKR